LTKLHQTSAVEDIIASLEQLAICTEGMNNTFFKECFINGPKENIQAKVHMPHPTTWLDASRHVGEA
jgi:hypothetical protein